MNMAIKIAADVKYAECYNIYRSNNIEFYISYSDLKLQNMLSVAQNWKQYSWSNNTFVERLLEFYI